VTSPPPVPDRVDRWILAHATLAVGGVMASALALRVAASRGTYLGSDEAVHYQLVNVSSVADVYRATLTNAHPPLFFFLLHFWRSIDSSELFLRLLPALFGTALLGVAYPWADRILDRRAAFYVLVILAFSPGLVVLSAEIRGYTLLLFLLAAALLLLERALERRSVPSMVGFSAVLALALLTHYSAAWFATTAFAYVAFRCLNERLPARLTLAWLTSQIAVVALFALLYRSHLGALRGSRLEDAIRNRADYFHSGQEGAFDFLGRQIPAFFRFFLGPGVSAILGLVLFLAGLAVLLRGRRRAVALLFALPILLGAAAGIADLYPFGGTRHSSYILVFAAAAIAVSAAAATGGRIWPALLLALLLAGSAWISRPDPSVRDRAHMKAAIDALRTDVAPGSLLFADFHSGLTLSYYLGGSDYFRANSPRGPFWKSSAGGYRLVGSYEWAFSAPGLASELRRLVEVHRFPAGQRIWIVHVGREIDPARVIAERYPAVAVGRSLRFGEIAIVEARLPGVPVAGAALGRPIRGRFAGFLRAPSGATLDAQKTVHADGR
jgi:hypothetical protein